MFTACDCHAVGSELTTGACQPIGGQCRCKPGVQGRVCDHCALGYYNFTQSGCTGESGSKPQDLQIIFTDLY